MGVFQSIYNLGPQGRKFRKAQSRLERAQANKAIADIQAHIDWREKEAPREQAHLKQGLWGRGLGKSSIATQDTERLTFMQKQQREALDRSMHVAIRYKQYLKKKRRHERNSAYAALLDSVVSLAWGAGGGAQSSNQGFSQNATSGPSSSGAYAGQYGGGYY